MRHARIDVMPSSTQTCRRRRSQQQISCPIQVSPCQLRNRTDRRRYTRRCAAISNRSLTVLLDDVENLNLRPRPASGTMMTSCTSTLLSDLTSEQDRRMETPERLDSNSTNLHRMVQRTHMGFSQPGSLLLQYPSRLGARNPQESERCHRDHMGAFRVRVLVDAVHAWFIKSILTFYETAHQAVGFCLFGWKAGFVLTENGSDLVDRKSISGLCRPHLI